MPARLASQSDALYTELRRVCFGFAGVEEKLSHGAPWFHVRGKMFAAFADQHHGDGRIALWCKATLEEQARLVREEPTRYFVPPYVGTRGWVGARLDLPEVDWIELAILLEAGWATVVPRSLAHAAAKPAPPPPRRARTDAAVAEAALARLTEACLALEGASVERGGKHATFRVKKRPFAYFIDNHHGDGVVGACFKVETGAQAGLAAADPVRRFVPAYLGPRGWLGVRLDLSRVDWREVARYARESHARIVAPRRRGRGLAALHQGAFHPKSSVGWRPMVLVEPS